MNSRPCLHQSHTFEIKNLILHENYSYTINVLNTNTPVVLSSISNDFIAHNVDYNLIIAIDFCPSFENCDSSNPNYFQATSNYVADKDYQCDIELVLKVKGLDIVVGIIPASIVCSIGNAISSPDITSTYQHINNDLLQINASVQFLPPAQTYKYIISSEANNNTFIATPISGTITTNDEGIASITSTIYRCPTPSLCPSGTAGLLQSKDNIYRDLYGNYSTFLSLKLDVLNQYSDQIILTKSLLIDDFPDSATGNGLPEIQVSNDSSTLAPNQTSPNRRPSLR